jgi:alpha-ketoglutarate-dependent taurine dioxygenase
MEPIYIFTEDERRALCGLVEAIPENPYTDYPGFQTSIARLADSQAYPRSLIDACARIRSERASGMIRTHVLRNCPVDRDLPALSPDNPLSEKHALKKTYVSEAFVALVAQLSGNPLMAYSATNEGRFFDDVIAVNRYSGTQSAMSDRDLVFHNDRSAHWARPDIVALLALRSPDEEVTYTVYIDGAELLRQLTPEYEEILRQPNFITNFNKSDLAYEATAHPILVGRSIRYVDAITNVLPAAPVAARDALIAFKSALTLGEKQRHRLLTGDLLLIENQEGLHCREKMEVRRHDRTRTRWLQKTYLFRDKRTADAYADKWHGGVPGLIAE